MTPFTFNTTPSIVMGSGTIARLGSFADRLGGAVLVVTDKGLVRAGLVAPAVDHLAGAGVQVSVFDEVAADPPEAGVLAAVDAARRIGATGIVGLGGGSSMDVAKLVAVLARGEQPIGEIYGIGNIKGMRLSLVLIPTTAGTGSEVTPISIVTTGENEKKGVVSPVLLPDIALLDPDLTLGLPGHVTAATGIDAMVHAIEAYSCINPNKNPLSKALAVEALRLLAGNIRTAVEQPDNVAARSAMLLGSMLAGQAFANSPVGAVHALAYPIGGIFHVPHGLSNALVLADVLRFNAGVPEAAAAYAELAPVVFPELAPLSAAERVTGFVEGLARLGREVGLPPRLRDVEIPEDALPRMAADAMRQQRLLVNNPRPLAEADALAIYQAAW